jgi:hypothetical protein
VVQEVIDRYVAIVEMLDSKVRLKIDQLDLETVIPVSFKSAFHFLSPSLTPLSYE